MKNCEFRRSVTPHFDSQAGYSSLFFFFFLPSLPELGASNSARALGLEEEGEP